MRVLGIVGGVASGKSLVSRQLQALGASMIDADKIGHEVLREPEVEAAVRARWGSGMLDEAGRVNRRAVAKIVFAPTPQGRAELAFLEGLTHPRITAGLKEELRVLRQRGNVPAVVLDAALLFRGGWDKLCDRVLFIDAPLEQRMARAQARGWSPADVSAREASQEPLEEKRRRSHDIIDNSGTPEETLEEVVRLWSSILQANNDVT